MPTIDIKEFRKALGAFATGVTIITTRDADGVDRGLTVNSFNSLSLDPPMVLWSLSKTSSAHGAFAKAAHWAVHVLANEQEELGVRFASKREDRFDGLPIERSESGIPLLLGCSARFECRKSFQYDGGDHVLFVGEVTDFQHERRTPLVFHGGTFSTTSRFPTSDLDVLSSDLAYLLVRAFFLIRAPVSERTSAVGLSLDKVHILALLMRCNRTRATIDEYLRDSVSGPSQQLIDELVADNLIKEDGQSIVTLSDRGRATLLELVTIGQAREADIVTDLTPEEVIVLKILLSRLTGSSAPADRKLLEALWAPAGGV
ncbi:flavin reductase family protein [Rhizorhabdus argentea]|uniref:flavin reductase family protein n=1 Tax=Rhizorhabdus argentea TaxID=1387174 RepID=UPI0030ED56CD